jgi:hypothetical protein
MMMWISLPAGWEPTTSARNATNDTRALRLRQPAVLEASRHHRSRPTMPKAHRLRLDERNTLVYRVGFIREQAVRQRDQLSLIERLETGCLCFHRDGRRDAPNSELDEIVS